MHTRRPNLPALLFSIIVVGAPPGVALGQPADADEGGAAAVATMGDRGFEVSSADGQYGLRIFGFGQLSGRFYLDDDEELGDDSFLVRRARPNLLLRAPAQTSLRIQLEVGGAISLLDAYVDWRPFDFFSLRVGRFKVPFGLELQQAPTAMDFIERGLPSTFGPNRDNGVMVFGDLGGGLLLYQLGVYNGAPDGGNSSSVDFTDQKELAARLFVTPFARSSNAALSGLGLGAAVTWGEDDGGVEGLGGLGGVGALASYRSAGRRIFFNYSGAVQSGARLRLTGQLFYYVGGFHIIGEYVQNRLDVSSVSDSAELRHSAWLAGAAYAIGGLVGPGGGVTPNANFSLDSGGLGALEIQARVSQAIFDSATFDSFADPDASAETATEIAAGLNWWWSRNVRWMFDFFVTQFDAPAGGTDLPDELALIMTVQLGL